MGEDRLQGKSFSDLVEIIRANNPDNGGENRSAIAEISVRAILMQQKSAEAQEKATESLIKSTWALVIATVALGIVGVVQLIR